jgi:glutaredoxin
MAMTRYCTKAKKYLTQAGAKFHTVEIDKTEGMGSRRLPVARNASRFTNLIQSQFTSPIFNITPQLFSIRD